ncbi:MAG TPA: chorismate-binding protein, partial [Pyrinomonadaceae bacterium]
RRGRWTEEDRELAGWLSASEKNRAENVMIVDLLRNDLGRIARTGSVEVSALCEIERYPTVFQMTSTVRARPRDALKLEELLGALFPCGSVTGAPKISTMRIIAEVEDAPRGVYCGSIGFISPQREATFNVAIRTLTINGRSQLAEYGVGGGITWDSNAADEYSEALLKADVLVQELADFQLLETLRLEDGSYTLLENHLERLLDSAQYFGFSLSLTDARAALKREAEERGFGAYRVRLLADRTGRVLCESASLTPLNQEAQPVALARRPVSRRNRFLYHKTTRRALYERALAEHTASFDVLLWNEEEELTEFTRGNLVLKIDGQLWTPKRESGLLAGTFRRELLDSGLVIERLLKLTDLKLASQIFFINSVRGWVEVRLVQ